MYKGEISIISIKTQFPNKVLEENEEAKYSTKQNDTNSWNVLHAFSILTVCFVFVSPWTLIPRTNSIIYQSHWFELNAYVMIFMILAVWNIELNLSTYFREKSIQSLRICLRMYVFMVSLWIVPYTIAYLIWCHFLGYNWPLPFLAYFYFVTLILFNFGIWIIFPKNLRSKIKFKKDFQMYMLYNAVAVMMTFFKEGVSLLLKTLPSYLQWIVAFLLPALKHLEKTMQFALVRKMTGGQDEASSVLLGLAVNAEYSFFISARLPAVETVTVCFIIAIDFVLQLYLTYNIVQVHNHVTDYGIEDRSVGQQKIVTKLVLAEVTEGLTPIIYALGFALAYYGPNGSILGSVRNSYWGYEKVDDVGYLFLMMLLLFGVDVFSVFVNYLILSKLTNVKLFQELCRIMKKFWLLVAVKFATKMCTWFVTKDINFGMDSTGNWDWITEDGRIQLISNSTDLSDEEKNAFLLQDAIR